MRSCQRCSRIGMGAFIVLVVASAGVSGAPASLPSDAAHSASPVPIGLVPRATHEWSGSGRLPIAGTVRIILQDDTAATRYAADCLRTELDRLFSVDAAILRESEGNRAGGVSVFVGEAAGGSLLERFPRLRELPVPKEDGYLLGVFPQERAAAVLGYGGNGSIRGVFALARLLAGDASECGWPEVLMSDTPDLRIRFSRDILNDSRVPHTMSLEDTLTSELDWWARWGLNHALVPLKRAKGEKEQDRFVRWYLEAAHRRGMKAGVNLGGRSLCPSDSAQMEAYLARARHLLGLGCDFFFVLFDDLPRERCGGHCERCIRKFGGSLAAEQRFILEALSDVLSESGPDRRLIWCPTYYSLGMTGYRGAAEGPEAYFSVLGASSRVRQAYMCHCAFDRDFSAYLDAKGLTHRIWWYNGIRTDYYMVSRLFDGYEGWGPPLRIPGLKDFQSFFSPFENGWLMPAYGSADPSQHRCIAPLAPAARDEQNRTVIPPSAWQELVHLPEHMEGLYLCGATTPYHIALAGVFGTHPGLFDQSRAEGAILDAMFARGASRYVTPWQTAYAQAQMLLARAQGSPLTSDALSRINDLLSRMETMEKALRECVANGKPALARPVLDGLLDEMSGWHAKIGRLAHPAPAKQGL